jgi:uncharacterized protein DUF4349
MESFDDRLSAELTALRPTLDPAFAAELDRRVAAGFPRRSGEGASAPERLRAWLRSLSPRRILVPAGAFAVLAIALATALVATREEGRDASLSNRLGVVAPSERPSRGGGAQDSGGAPGWEGVQFEAEVPAAGGASAGPYASDAGQREIERSAEMVLAAEPADVATDAAKVFDAVHAVDGIVLRSSVRGGAEDDAGADFELLIPSAKLGDALASFSAIGTVVSRHEATADITAPTVRTGELLRDSRARIEGLLTQLAGADTDAERVATEAQLRAERRHNAALRAELAKLQRRANLSRVSLRIETGAGAEGDESGGAWGVGDALDDAGRILGIAAGVAVIGLAVLAPFALIALLAWLGNRARRRRARERALA